MSTPTSPEPRSLEDIERWWGESERDILTLVAEVRRLRAATVDWMNRYEAAVEHERAAVVERDALRAAIRTVMQLHQNSTRTGINVCVHCHKAWPCPTVAALAAAGVDREDTEQPQRMAAREAASHVTSPRPVEFGVSAISKPWSPTDAAMVQEHIKAAARFIAGDDEDELLCVHGKPFTEHDDFPDEVGDTGQADEPQRQWGGQLTHMPDPYKAAAGQVVPQQPTPAHDFNVDGEQVSAQCVWCGVGMFAVLAGAVPLTCTGVVDPGPVGLDTTGDTTGGDE